MVTTVSIVKKIAKTIKKFIFSYPILEVLEFKIGIKSANETPIFKQVANKKVNPTLSILLCFTNSNIKIITKEQDKKKQ
jgi:hypothetical protein